MRPAISTSGSTSKVQCSAARMFSRSGKTWASAKPSDVVHELAFTWSAKLATHAARRRARRFSSLSVLSVFNSFVVAAEFL
jgi:hypothetical protein